MSHLYLMSSFWLCGGVGRAARMSTLFTSSVTDSARAKNYLEQNYNLSEDHTDECARYPLAPLLAFYLSDHWIAPLQMSLRSTVCAVLKVGE